MANYIEVIGALAALMTTFSSLPQILKILKDRQARDISLAAQSTLASGIVVWIVYGFFIGSLPVILANSVTFLFISTIIGLKLRYG